MCILRVPAYDMPTVRYEVIRPRHIYKSIVHVPAVSKKEGVDSMVEGAVDGIEITMSMQHRNQQGGIIWPLGAGP